MGNVPRAVAFHNTSNGCYYGPTGSVCGKAKQAELRQTVRKTKAKETKRDNPGPDGTDAKG